MKLFVAGLSYKTAPVTVREKLAVAAHRLKCHGCRLRLAGGLEELVLVSTCNRVEIYAVAHWPQAKADRLFAALSSEAGFDFTPYLYVREGVDAVRHLFGVAGGLDSMVVGETEITGQVKQAYQAALDARLSGRVTNRLFQGALQTAKAIRTRTGIGKGATSVGSVAVELAERIFDNNLSSRRVMIVGAGQMGEACVRHLAKKGAREVLVVNRSLDRAEKLAQEFGGRALKLDEMYSALSETDIVVSSTGAAGTVLHKADLARVLPARRGRPLFLVDIAVPRDIDEDVEELSDVFLYNVDHLESIVQENVRLRQGELRLCQELIEEYAVSLMPRLERDLRRGHPEAAVAPRPEWALAGA
jgi:glutamyl-tRNA reductase